MEDSSPASRCPWTQTMLGDPVLSLPSFFCLQGSQSCAAQPDPAGLEGAVHVALGDGITRSPACGVLVSSPSVQAQPLAWHEPLGRSRRGLLCSVGDPARRFSAAWHLVFGSLRALLTLGFPFAPGTGACSFTFSSKCMLPCCREGMPRLLERKGWHRLCFLPL